ncbi:Hypothetical protein R9X50_00769100 [Acrodontium crateriforme]|uniref:Uncharacterized protein n=1 Tax=Acrodontium crateriforme TaxID=150365 RepID=A0AAQ3MBL7_9PEZI|nr:Hypothetical protein R9X50_00769100 [Acrodontium crateriforme]
MIARVEPGVETWVNYYKAPADGSPPELNDLGLLLGNKNMETRLMRINDARGREQDFTLDDHGFQFARLESNVTDFTDKEYVKKHYYPEVESLVKRITGCKEVKSFAFNHRTAPTNDFGKPFAGYQGTQGPAKRLHVDSSPLGAAHMVDHMWPSEATDIHNRGYLFINVWRPLATIRRDPLIVADMSLWPETDLIKIERKYYDGMIGQNYVPKYDGSGAVKRSLPTGGTEDAISQADQGVATGHSNGGQHSWWYLDEMKPDEVVLFSCSGKRPGMKTTGDGGTVHGSVDLPDQHDMPVRQSVEVHLVAIW